MIPDGQNELRKLQLRELALLNGTLRPEDVLSGARCSNCGSDQHKTFILSYIFNKKNLLVGNVWKLKILQLA